MLLRMLLMYVRVATELVKGVNSLQAEVLKDAHHVVGIHRGLFGPRAHACT